MGTKWEVVPSTTRAGYMDLWAPGDRDLQVPTLEVPVDALVASYMDGLCRSLNANGVTAEEGTTDILNDLLSQLLVTVTAAFDSNQVAATLVASMEATNVTAQDLEDAQRGINNARNLKAPELLREALRTKALLLIADSLHSIDAMGVQVMR